MGGTVGADQAAAVEREHHRQVLDLHVVDQLVVAALQERRVDRHHRFVAFAGHAGGEGHRMLFGNSHIKVALGILLCELDHARAFAHRRCDAHQPRIFLRHVAQPFAENLGIGRLACAALLPGGDTGLVIEFRHTVIEDRVSFGQLVALTLARDHVQKLRALEAPDVVQRRHQCVEIVTVNRPDVVETELLEHRARRDHALDVFFSAARKVAQYFGAEVLGRGVKTA